MSVAELPPTGIAPKRKEQKKSAGAQALQRRVRRAGLGGRRERERGESEGLGKRGVRGSGERGEGEGGGTGAVAHFKKGYRKPRRSGGGGGGRGGGGNGGSSGGEGGKRRARGIET